jgi:hypothetical protein
MFAYSGSAVGFISLCLYITRITLLKFFGVFLQDYSILEGRKDMRGNCGGTGGDKESLLLDT